MHPSEEELSAYINGDITDLDELQRLEAHLETCARCRETLSELRALVWLLRRTESPVPSRSFRLDPSVVGAQVAPVEPWIVRIQPALRRLTAIAAVLLVFLVVADVLVHQNGRESATQSVGATTETSAASAALAPAATAASSQAGTTSAGSNAQPAAATSASAFASSADSATKSAAGTPVATAAVGAISQPQPTLPPPSSPAPTTRPSYWRLLELAVGVVVIWLLFLTVALPRLVRQRESLRSADSKRE
jgi:hypothetical protein